MMVDNEIFTIAILNECKQSIHFTGILREMLQTLFKKYFHTTKEELLYYNQELKMPDEKKQCLTNPNTYLQSVKMIDTCLVE